jgi:O-antigen/teichoic acid export membrane protein
MLAQKESIADLLKTAFQWMFFLTASLSFCVLFFGNDLTYWMLDAATPYTVAVFGLLIWSSHAAGIIYVFGTLLTSSGNLKWMNLVFALGLLLNLIGNALLIPHYGAWGAALATLVTQSFVALAELYLVYRFIPSARPIFRWIELFRILLLCAGMFMLYGLVSTYGKYYIDWRLGLLFSGLCGLAWAERIGFLDLKGFFKILRSKNL